MKRSVHVTNAWHSHSGGVRTFYEALLAGAERERRHLALVVPGERTWCERRSAFTRIYTIRAPHSPVFDRRYRIVWPHRYVAVSRSAVGRILHREQPDVVETCDKYTWPLLSGLVKRRAGDGPRPTLIGLSCERMDDNVRLWVSAGAVALAASRAYLRRVYLPLFDGHIANSEYTAEELRSIIARHAGDDWRLSRLTGRVCVGPMGVDLDGFSPTRRSSALRERLLAAAGGHRDSRLLVYAGRISPEKHIMNLTAMMQDLSDRRVDARLVICGDGPLRAAVEQAGARCAQGPILVLGHVTRGTLASVLASADVFVHPNPHEPFGIGPLEAMASGSPVVLPRSGGVLSYATDHNAWLSDPTGVGLAHSVAAVLAQPAEAEARRARALIDVHRWSWPSAVDTYFRHYDNLDEARRSDAGRQHLRRARVFAAPRQP